MTNQLKRQNRLFSFLITGAFITLLSSCTTQKITISQEKFEQSCKDLETEMLSQGFSVISTSIETKNDVIVKGTAHDIQSGYTTLYGNDITLFHNYTYMNAEKQKVDIEISYQSLLDYNKKPYIATVVLSKCSSDDPKVYSMICAENGTVKKVEKIKPNQQSAFYDKTTSSILYYGGALAGAVLLYQVLANGYE
jgi:hypothetical protein